MSGGTVSVHAAALRGTETVGVSVEVSTSGGIPGLDVVGMPDSAVLEARSRIRCAMRSCGFSMPRERVTINLAPGGIRKSGTAYDLPMAVAVLLATGQIPRYGVDGCLFAGELGLDGTVNPVRGDVAYAMRAQRDGLELVTSAQSPLPGGWAGSVRAIGALGQLKGGVDALSALGAHRVEAAAPASEALDFGDVVDQELAKRAMVIAAAGGHGMLMIGPPGAGKTMLARRLPTILPPLDEREAAEALLVHSVAGQPIDAVARGERPFRAPHHSISTGGLVGGGRPVLPGEISLAHHGVLFLDELPEFARDALQALRQPLEDGEVHVARVEGVYTFPCDFQLVAAANPCPCGHLGDEGHACTCPPARVAAYQARMGGPLMDRIDVVVDVARPKGSRVIRGQEGTTSSEMAEQVAGAREFRAWREGREGADGGALAGAHLDARATTCFEELAERLALGGRAIVRVARVARTIADLAQRELVGADDIVEALGFRPRAMG